METAQTWIVTEVERMKLDSLQKDKDIESFVWQVLDYARLHSLTADHLRSIFGAGIVMSATGREIPLPLYRDNALSVVTAMHPAAEKSN